MVKDHSIKKINKFQVLKNGRRTLGDFHIPAFTIMIAKVRNTVI